MLSSSTMGANMRYALRSRHGPKSVEQFERRAGLDEDGPMGQLSKIELIETLPWSDLTELVLAGTLEEADLEGLPSDDDQIEAREYFRGLS